MMVPIAKHEFRYLLRSFQTIGVFAVFFGIAFLITANGSEFQTTIRGGNVNANSPYKITALLVALSVFAIFIVPSFMANAILKDRDHRFDGILFSTPISKRDYLMGRFSGAFGAMMLALSGAPIGMLLGSFWPWADPGTLGPTQFSVYLKVVLGFVGPGMAAMAAIIFSVAAVTRHLLSTYLAALAMLILYLIVGETDVLPPFLDPFLYRTFEAQTQYWTAVECNTKHITYEGLILLNRLFWFGVAICFLAISYKLFRFRAPIQKTKKSRKPKASGGGIPPAGPIPEKSNTPAWTRGTALSQFVFRTKFEAMAVMKSWPFVILMALNGFLLLTALIDREVMYQVNAHPLTRLMVQAISGSLVWALLAVLVFYSADMIWRERHTKFHEIMDATPTPNWVFVLSKLFALWVVLGSIYMLGIALAILLQTLDGYHHYELALYLKRGLFFFLSQFIFLSVLASFFQVIAKSRLTGMVLMGLFMALNIGSADLLGLEHPLFKYAIGGMGEAYSDMNGHGRFIVAGYWHRVYWAAGAGFLVLGCFGLWNRGTLQPLKLRFRQLRTVKPKAFRISVLLLAVTFLGSGSFIFYNTNIMNPYVTSDGSQKLRMTYEKQYRKYENLPMPRTIDIEMDVDIFPYKHRIEIRGIHTLLNKTNRNITTIHFTFPSGVTILNIELETATQSFNDNLFNYYIFDLKKPLKPAEKIRLEFEALVQQAGFPHARPDTRLVRNGSFIHNNQIAPYIGFNPGYMIDDRNTRRRLGLEPLPRVPALEDTSQYNNSASRQDSDFVTFETTVSTAANQVAVSIGTLEKEWLEGNRRFFTYKMNAPIRNFYAYLSAEYETVRQQWNGIDIEVFHHAPHDTNIDRMIAGIKDSISYFNKVFSPYQYKQIRILEFPAYRNFAQAFSNTIPYSEGMGFVADVKENDIDMPYYVTAHEMAHQWWGHQLVPANTQGASFLNETLAQYSALLVMEQKYGQHKIRKFLKFEIDRYLSGRAQDPEGELPLFKVENQEYIHYRKGSLIMYALRDYLGEALVNRTLRRLLERRAYSSNPYATSLDFLHILKQEAGPPHHGLIEDFFEKITLYDVKLRGSRVVPLADGRFRVSLDVTVAKFYADEIGNERESPFDIPVDIGLFQETPAHESFNDAHVILLDKFPLAPGQSTLEFTVDQKPLFAGIDPYNKLIDRHSDDNIAPVEETGPNPSLTHSPNGD